MASLSGCLTGSETISMESSPYLGGDKHYWTFSEHDELSSVRIRFLANNRKVLKHRTLKVPIDGPLETVDRFPYGEDTSFSISMLVSTGADTELFLDTTSLKLSGPSDDIHRPHLVSTEAAGVQSVCHLLVDESYVQHMLPNLTRMISLKQLPDHDEDSGCVLIVFGFPIRELPPTTSFELFADFYIDGRKVESTIEFSPKEVTVINY